MSLICTKLPGSLPILSTSRHCDLFRQVAPQTCFPALYPPPASCLAKKPLATSFVPPATSRVVRSPASCSHDESSLTNLFGRMTTTTLGTNSGSPRNQGVFWVPGSEGIKPLSPILSPSDSITKPQLMSVKSTASPTKPTNATRRRKIASLPIRWSKTSASPSPPVFNSAGATSYSSPRVVEEAHLDHLPASSQKTRLVPTLPSSRAAEAQYFATPKYSTPRQRKVHTLRKTLHQTQPIPQNQTLKPLAKAGETFSYNVSRSPPLVSDATSYFDSPPTSSDELDTPPSTPPSSHVLLASTSTESLAISSVSDRIVSHKELLSDAKLPYPRQRYRRLDFTKGSLGRDEQPLTFTFSV
jgi:hypothetical protein